MDLYDERRPKALPFLQSLEPKQNKFGLKVPSHFVFTKDNKPRKLFFSDLILTPEFYSMEAVRLNLDSNTELDSIVSFDLQFSFNINPTVYPKLPADGHRYILQKGTSMLPLPIETILKNINQHFSKLSVIPELIQFPPIVFDWVSTSDPDYKSNALRVRQMEKIGLVFYGEAFNSEIHENALPQRMRKLEFANNCRIPPFELDNTKTRIRARICLAPNTVVYFSNLYILLRLGFTENQVEKFQKQYFIRNDSPLWKFIRANRVYDSDISLLPLQVQDSKIHIQINDTKFTSKLYSFSMPRRKWYNLRNVFEKLSTLLEEMTLHSLIKIQCDLDIANDTIKFIFPPQNADSSISHMKIKCSTQFAKRLNYGPITEITPQTTLIPKLVSSGEDWGKTLVYDTMAVMVSSDALRTSFDVNFTNETYLGLLLPCPDGTLKLSYNCTEPLYLTLPSYELGSNVINISFRLSTFNPNGQMYSLEWNNASTLSGQLVSQLT